MAAPDSAAAQFAAALAITMGSVRPHFPRLRPADRTERWGFFWPYGRFSRTAPQPTAANGDGPPIRPLLIRQLLVDQLGRIGSRLFNPAVAGSCALPTVLTTSTHEKEKEGERFCDAFCDGCFICGECGDCCCSCCDCCDTLKECDCCSCDGCDCCDCS